MRYVPHSAADQQALLNAAGFNSLEGLFADLPARCRLDRALDLPSPLSEPELLAELAAASQQNQAPDWLGGGCYRHFIPSVVKHLVSRSEFYTAYTPYQAEASQGTLQAIFEYQTMICELTGMAAANASMYDGATALAEAALLACRATGRREILVSAAVNPSHRQVLKTYAVAADLIVKELPFDQKTGQSPSPQSLASGTACYILQQPNYFGVIEQTNKLVNLVHSTGALFIVSADPVSLGLLKPPGSYGADIVVGEGQSLGNPAAFGGPGLGLFAVKQELIRQLPGRLVGQTVDSDGKRGFVLTLSTREQHIRREKATSNICSNEALAALAATVYLSVMGKQGLRKVAELCLQKANYLKKKLGKKLVFGSPSFCELVVRSNKECGLDLGRAYPELSGCRLVCVTELSQKSELEKLAASL
jgi:glycine dehydrogenase subunit 1